MKGVVLILVFSFLVFYSQEIKAQVKRYTLSGVITDSHTGEILTGASVYESSSLIGEASDVNGFYSLHLPEGNYTIKFSFIGYIAREVEVKLNKDTKLDIGLEIELSQLEEIVIKGRKENENVSRPEMSVENLSAEMIKSIPAFMGEVDVLKAIQLLPGVQSVSEASSGFSVRGGSHDQNLVLLDEALIYSASHLMGFFSVFNNDVIDHVKLYKGDIPATFGGRLSSLLDIRTREGNNDKFSGTGGIGLIASRLTLEGPIAKDKATFLVSGRRTYADAFLKLASDKDLRKARLYFYDANMKLNWHINENNRLYLNGYLGRDNFSNNFAGMDFGNKTMTFRWNHIFSPKIYSNLTFLASIYDYYLRSDMSSQLTQDWKSQIQDYSAKLDLSYHITPRNIWKAGYQLTYHRFMPGEGGGIGESSIVAYIKQPHEYALEHAFYATNELAILSNFTFKYGLRYSLFQNISNGREVEYLLDYTPVHTATYRRGKVYHRQYSFEPRFGLLYKINSENSLKGSYSRTNQFIQLASNSSAGSPLDVWFQASQNVKPQLCDQMALGYFKNFLNNTFEASAEIYYKKMKNVVDFKDHAELLGNEFLHRELRFGKGNAHGVELMVRKNKGRLNGWVSYTYARGKRIIDDVNNYEWYKSPYDKPINISIVANYELSPKWSIAANWVFSSGMPVTYPTGRYLIENTYIPIYSGRNEHRYPAYHRLDLSATCKLSPANKRFKSELNFSLYNAYGRKNPWTIYFKQESEKPNKSYAEMLYLFSFVPSISYNFTF